MPRQPVSPSLDAEARMSDTRLFSRKADAEAKGKFIPDPMVGSAPPHVDFTAS